MNIRGYVLAHVRKAIVGGVAAAGGTFAAAISDGVLTRTEGGAIVAAFVVGALAVFGVRNKPMFLPQPTGPQDDPKA